MKYTVKLDKNFVENADNIVEQAAAKIASKMAERQDSKFIKKLRDLGYVLMKSEYFEKKLVGIRKQAVKEYKQTQRRVSCDYCEHMYKGKNAAYKRHLLICYKNPNRTCEECRETGLRMRFAGISRRTWKAVYRADGDPCGACKTAVELGGKSYIKVVFALQGIKDKIIEEQ